MFRELARKKQKLSDAECIELLKAEPRGVLSVQGEDGYPYGMPMNHWYCEENGHIYFHSGMKGHKVDAIRNCEKVSFCVYDQGFRREGEWALNIRSVVVFTLLPMRILISRNAYWIRPAMRLHSFMVCAPWN